MNSQTEPSYTTRTLDYSTAQGLRLCSHLCLPKQASRSLGGVIVFPEWWGMSEHAKQAAERLAAQGYAALTADLYGEASLTDHAATANERMLAVLADPQILAERTQLALEALGSLAEVDAGRIAAIGFCFGGKVALDMARRGAPLQAVASFHGNLTPQTPAQPGVIQAEILIEHGGRDSMVSMESLDAFRKEMDAAGVRYHVDVFPQARHGFSNPQATANGEKNGVDLAYDAEAAAQAWQNVLALLARKI